MSNALLKILKSTAFVLKLSNLRVVKLMALPTANRKDGNTRSVGVKPNQAACSSGANGCAPLPGVFTMIIKQMVIPRKTSSERNLSGFWFIVNEG
jgi:hypothetical protein